MPFELRSDRFEGHGTGPGMASPSIILDILCKKFILLVFFFFFFFFFLKRIGALPVPECSTSTRNISFKKDFLN